MKKIFHIDPLLKTKSPDILVREPIVIYVSEIDDESVQDFDEEMSEAHNTGQPVIPVVINCEGGSVYGLMAMISAIEAAEIPVATIVTGTAMSAATILLSCGTEGYRYADLNATIMIHDVSSWHGGKAEEVKADAKETDRLNKVLCHKMAKNCGQTTNYFLNLVHEKGHVDWYLTAKQAQKHNIVNHVYMPSLTIDIKVNMDFG